jgi:hypothetical protein
MGEKPNENDEGARGSGTTSTYGRSPAAVADLDQDGMSDEKKAGPRAGEGQGKEEAAGSEQERRMKPVDESPAGIAIGDQGTVEEKGGPRAGLGGGGGGGEPAQGTNLNSSKSNLERAGGPGPADPGPQGTNLNSSKSNIERAGSPGPADPAPDEATNLNSSRSN